MTLYCVSIEPMYSQGVGDYEYLCDSIEKVELFRDVLRAWAEDIKEKASDANYYLYENIDPEDLANRTQGVTGWEFFERVYIVESLNHTTTERTESYTQRRYMETQSSVRRIHEAHYWDFWWLEEPKIEIDYTSTGEEEETLYNLPNLDRVKDNVSGEDEELIMTLADFISREGLNVRIVNLEERFSQLAV